MINNYYLLPFYDFLNLENIGSGAFAQVYKGYEKLPSIAPLHKYREVALKRINLAAITDPAIYKTTINEVKIFSSLDHKNIVKCYRSFEEISPFSQIRYLILVLEYINGGDLHLCIQDRAIKQFCFFHEYEIWYLFEQISSAVYYIHSKKIMHRDLKPPNILLNNNYFVKLADFGLSRLNLAIGGQAKTVCGTPYYMSPERINEEPYTFASDIWSLGCILYEMAALKSPFFGEKENLSSLIQKIRSANFPPIADRFSPQLEYLIESCMNPNMEERPTACEVFNAAQHMNNLWVKWLNEQKNEKNKNEENIIMTEKELLSSSPKVSTSSTNTFTQQIVCSEFFFN
ncbi:Protein kinase domain-containing protein [Meloidogyne graminicola]|uniref:non-specific serine/threonine protein kinase n=1 Tax=Meloidogyne graminicola TaxID=189291 RepID=A0A8S9ZHL3_9BILA|nr:Protein kinase domain-containing protein [Meloidogyne graminicola]